MGGFFLAVALGMVVLGQTILKSRLQGTTYVNYWLACFGCAITAVIVAWLDLRVLRLKSRDEQRQLLEKTLHQPEGRGESHE